MACSPARARQHECCGGSHRRGVPGLCRTGADPGPARPVGRHHRAGHCSSSADAAARPRPSRSATRSKRPTSPTAICRPTHLTSTRSSPAGRSSRASCEPRRRERWRRWRPSSVRRWPRSPPTTRRAGSGCAVTALPTNLNSALADHRMQAEIAADDERVGGDTARCREDRARSMQGRTILNQGATVQYIHQPKCPILSNLS